MSDGLKCQRVKTLKGKNVKKVKVLEGTSIGIMQKQKPPQVEDNIKGTSKRKPRDQRLSRSYASYVLKTLLINVCMKRKIKWSKE